MISKIALALSPLLVAALVAQSDEVCAHPDGAGRTIAYEPATWSPPRGIEISRSLRTEGRPLPACPRQESRAIPMKVPAKLVGKEWVFEGGLPADLVDRFKLRCLPCRVRFEADRAVVEEGR